MGNLNIIIGTNAYDNVMYYILLYYTRTDTGISDTV